MAVILPRRSFLAGFAAAFAAPAIVRAESLMALPAFKPATFEEIVGLTLQSYSTELEDVVLKMNALLRRLTAHGLIGPPVAWVPTIHGEN